MARQSQQAAKVVAESADDQIRTAIPVVLNILDKWHCTEEEKRALLGQLPRSSFYRLQKSPESVLSLIHI